MWSLIQKHNLTVYSKIIYNKQSFKYLDSIRKEITRYKHEVVKDNNTNIISTILAVRKVGHLDIKTRMLNFEVRVLIGWLTNTFASQPIRRRA